MEVDKRGDAFRGIPKIGLLIVLEFYLGVPWSSLSLVSFHSLLQNPSNPYPKLENFTTQNSTVNLISSVSARNKDNHIRYCNELMLYLYWC